MNRLISAEALKLHSTRTGYALALGALAVIWIAAALAAALMTFHHGDHSARDVLSIAGVAQTFALLIGVLAVTTEYRYGTITAVLLVTPRRSDLLTAKAIVVGLSGLALGLVAFGSATAIVLPVLSSRGIPSQLGGHLTTIIAGGTLATALFGMLGVGIGAVLRNQVAAIIAALGLLYVIEPLLTMIPGVGDAAQRVGLGALSSAVSGTTSFGSNIHRLSQVPGAVLLAGYALAALAAGTAILSRRDITA